VRDIEQTVPTGARFCRRWIFSSTLALAAALYCVQGRVLAERMVTWTDESAYVHLGYLSVTGQISRFQDELTGSRMPLPFWTVGGSQVLWGRSLLAARLTGLGLGLGALALVALIARQMAGDLRAGSLTRKEAAHVPCGSGFWGGQRLESRRLRHGDGATRGATAAGGASVDYPLKSEALPDTRDDTTPGRCR
jgi:hypothetical protein